MRKRPSAPARAGDLGAATEVTKGSQKPYLPDEISGQYMRMPGLAQD